jgi:threonine aldolase
VDFGSDNAYGVLPQVMDALARANQGTARAYGGDALTQGLAPLFSALFGRTVAVHPVVTGTAANALALATVTAPHGAVFCHAHSHIMQSECGAPEFYAHGARLIGIEGPEEGPLAGKLTAQAIGAAIDSLPRGFVHSVQPFAVSISQPTELGTVYGLEELAAIARTVHARGLKLHLDGARLANALAHLGAAAPADLAAATWQAGVDLLSFGASKGGTMGAEAVVYFNPADAGDFEYRRKKGGHLASKMRFVSAQLEAYVADGLWLQSAARANALAQRLAEGLSRVGAVRLPVPVQTNMVFALMPAALAARLRAAGAYFYDWRTISDESGADGQVLARLATSFATPDAAVTRFVEVAAAA